MLKIMLDAGHNGKYNKGVNSSYYESVAMWKLHEFLKAALEEYDGVTVGTTRANVDAALEVEARGKRAKGYDLMLSLHSNASAWKNTKRVEVYRPISGKAAELAAWLAPTVYNIMALKKESTWSWQVKTKKWGTKDYYGVIRGAASVGVPCLIIEHSFHTNPEACAWLLNDDNLKKLANAEAATIASYYKLNKKTAREPEKTDAFKPCLVRVDIPDLNIRTGAGTNYPKTGKYTGKGVFTIVEVADGKGAAKWGLLKSGAGWISLDYAVHVRDL